MIAGPNALGVSGFHPIKGSVIKLGIGCPAHIQRISKPYQRNRQLEKGANKAKNVFFKITFLPSMTTTQKCILTC